MPPAIARERMQPVRRGRARPHGLRAGVCSQPRIWKAVAWTVASSSPRPPAIGTPLAPIRGMRPIRSIVVAVDLEAPSVVAARSAIELARRLGASVTLVHVLVDPSGFLRPQDALPASALESMHRQGLAKLEAFRTGLHLQGVEVHLHVIHSGSVAEEVVAWARATSADLVVVGTHGRGPLGRFLLGSVAERVLRGASCPVLVAR